MRPKASMRAWRIAAATGLAALVLGGVRAGTAAAAPVSAEGLARSVGAQAATAGSTSWLPPTPPGWPLVLNASRTPARVITSGVTQYSQTLDTVAGRQRAQVLNVDLADENVRVRAVEAGNTLIDPADETVRSMGTRTRAVAGINGGYFDIHASGQPVGGSVVDGQIYKSPPAGFNAELSVLADGTMKIGQEKFSGTITDGPASESLTSVNIPADAAAGRVTEVTPVLAVGAQPLSAAATLVSGTVSGAGGNQMLTVTGVRTGITSLRVPAAGTAGLLSSGAGGTWLADHVRAGDALTISERLTPDPDVTQLVTAATQLIKDGRAYTDPTGLPSSPASPETAVGVSRDGRHAVFVAFDGRLGEPVAAGVSAGQVTGYLLARGAYNAVLLDGGGSTEMDARVPGDTGLSVLSTPSDGSERPVANGLFVYSTAASAGPPAKIVINDGGTVETLQGATVPVPAYATDADGNPAAGTVAGTAVPGSLGTWAGGQFTARRSGAGELIVRDGSARSVQRIDVVRRLGSLAVTPAAPDLGNGQAQRLTLSGTAPDGSTVRVPPQAASWSVADPSLGEVSASGLFTAADSGTGLTGVTATAGGKSASASVAVGSASTVIDDMGDTANWSVSARDGATAIMTEAPGVVPRGDTAAGSLRVSYDFPAGTGVKQVVFWPKRGDHVTADPAGLDPTGIGLWIKGAGAGPELAESYLDVNGTATTLYPSTITWRGWQFVVCQLPPGMNFPLRVRFLDLLTISNSAAYKATVNFADLEALYSPRPVTATPYVAIPRNPSWLRYEESSADFSAGGSTILTGDDAHLRAADPGSASAHVLAAIARRLPALAGQARPNTVQAMGDMSDDGLLPDLRYARTETASLGEPYHDAVGNHEITQGANAENGDFRQVFGDTHYAYTDGPANVIVTDSAHGGLLASDAYQVPAGPQYPWLVRQLSGNTSPVVLVATHEPAYDPHAAADSQFSDRWEARMYLQLVYRYRQTHPKAHVVMLYGHARGFAEQILNPEGQVVGPGQGIPQLTVADLGMPAYAPADEGGFCNFALLHATAGGDLQFTVEPVLASIRITPPSGTLTAGKTERLSATGTTVGGDNNPAVTLPIADPASHRWSSGNAKVASVDAGSGVVTAHRAGTAAISVTSGGLAAWVTVTVSRPRSP